MKRLISIMIAAAALLALAVPVFAAESSYSQGTMKSALVFLTVITVVLLLLALFFTFLTMQSRRSRRNPSQRMILRLFYLAALVGIVCTAVSFGKYRSFDFSNDSQAESPQAESPQANDLPSNMESQDTTAPTEEMFHMRAKMTAKTDPANWGIRWDIIDHGSIKDTYQRQEPIHFGKPEEYFALPGIGTFRGNNYRNAPTYGTANVTQGQLEPIWKNPIGSLNGWPGSGWTGQPLIVQWDAATRAVMNLTPEKKAKDGLVEVIYATLDGYVYFYDLEDGQRTREPIYLGMNFKGAGSIDPRGYPIMYVGSGDNVGDTAPKFYIVSLIDGSILFQRSGKDTFSQREWCAFDSSPLVDAETDTLIWPGESGILYTLKLNTNFDQNAGTLTMNPEEIVKTRYYPERYTDDIYWIGYEPSAVIVDHYLYTSENGGLFFCIDLNTMELVWAQDTKDDSNSTPVFEWGEDGNGYLYTAPSLHWTAQEGNGTISIYKLDAKTGEIVWEVPFDCHTIEGVSGGVQSTPLLGKPGTELEGMIFYTIARTPDTYNGKFVAFDTKTGEILWQVPMDNYAWSSPVALYNDDGTAHIIISDSVGKMSMLNAKGKVVTSIDLGSNVEATPAVYNDMIVVGTRGQQIYGIKAK